MLKMLRTLSRYLQKVYCRGSMLAVNPLWDQELLHRSEEGVDIEMENEGGHVLGLRLEA